MNKCQSCGTEFEGNFCPSCGVRVGQKRKCPKCGAEVSENARFCNRCGSLLLSREEEVRSKTVIQSQPYKPTQTYAPFFSTERKRSILSYAPTVLFCLFTALLFIFYALSTAKMGDSEIGWESLGSIYTMSSSDLLLSVPQIKWLLVMMIILLCLCALHSILMLANLKYAFLEKLEKFSFVYYALYLIASITICIYLAIEGEGAFATGAGTVCILVFSILSILLGGASLYLRKKFYEQNPNRAAGELEIRKNVLPNEFANKIITSLTVGAEVKYIGKNAFGINRFHFATFENPNQWYVKREGKTEKIYLSANEVSNKELAAQYLCLTYREYSWYQEE